jgi:hypothetical protein
MRLNNLTHTLRVLYPGIGGRVSALPRLFLFMGINDYTPKDIHIDQDLSGIGPGLHNKELFFNCTFNNLNGLSLIDCDLNRSAFTTDKVEDALGFTLTLGCRSFQDVTFSELLFDLMLCLLIKSKGNTEKRKQLINLMGRSKVATLLKTLERLEA